MEPSPGSRETGDASARFDTDDITVQDDDAEALGQAYAAVEERSLSRRRTGRLLLLQATVDSILERYPGLHNEAHRKLFVHSLVGNVFHTSVDRSGHHYTRIAIPRTLLADIEDRYKELIWRKYVGRDFLNRHKEIVPGFECTTWGKGLYPRQIRESGLADDLYELIVADLSGPVSEAERFVDLATLETVSCLTGGRAVVERKAERDRLRAWATHWTSRSPWLLPKRLARLLNDAPTNTLAVVVREGAPAAIKAALAVLDRDRRLRTLATLREIRLAPDIVYVASRNLHTPRLFSATVSALGLPRDVRKALFGGCIELDLANAQLACAAREWNVWPLLDHLWKEGAIWPYLIRRVAGTHSLSGPDAKASLKVAVYSVVFGMSLRGLRRLITSKLSAEAARTFLTDPLMASLLAARDAALARIDAEGRIVDCEGVERRLVFPTGSPQREAECRSALAGAMQALEMKILEPIVDEIERARGHQRTAFRVIGWLHDGLVIRASSEGVVRRLVRLVDEQAERLGVPTRLEVTRHVSCAPHDPLQTDEVMRRAREAIDIVEARQNELDKLYEQTVPGGLNGLCRLWQGAKDRDGYGRLRIEGRRVGAHRVSWEIANGEPVPPGLVVRHTCHTPACVNPDHLTVGTQAENIADRDAAGRTAKGAQNGRSTLTDATVREARKLAGSGERISRIARRFGVDPSTARAAIRGRTWAHVTEGPAL